MNGQSFSKNMDQVNDVKISGVSVKTIKEADLNKIYGETGVGETIFGELEFMYYRNVQYSNGDTYRFDLQNGTCYTFYLDGAAGIDINGVRIGDDISILEDLYPQSYLNKEKNYLEVKLTGHTHQYLKYIFSPYTKIIEAIEFKVID